MHPDELTPNEVDVHVGTVIRQRRKALGYSQQHLAKAAGITFQQIQKYERGANRVSASMLWKLANALKCKPGELFLGLPVCREDRATNDPNSFGRTGLEFFGSEGGLELACAYLAMDPDHRRALLAAARAFSQSNMTAFGRTNTGMAADRRGAAPPLPPQE